MERIAEVLAGGGRVVGEMTEMEYEALAAQPLVAEQFGVVKVRAMSVAETVEVLRSHRPALEVHHGVTIADKVLQTAASMGANVVPPRVLPGTAVDLLDEAASRQRALGAHGVNRVRGASGAHGASGVSGLAGADRQTADSWQADEHGRAGGSEGVDEEEQGQVALTRRTVAEVASRRSGHRLEQLLPA